MPNYFTQNVLTVDGVLCCHIRYSMYIFYRVVTLEIDYVMVHTYAQPNNASVVGPTVQEKQVVGTRRK